jgi:uncharacterized protein (DUF1778 family)
MDPRKDNLIRVRVTSDQQRSIQEAAAKQSKTTSQFVRDQTLQPAKKGLIASLFSRRNDDT